MVRRVTCWTGRSVLLGSTAIVFACIGGCGVSSEAMLPVQGKIQFAGKPLIKGTVVLYPDASKNNTTKHEPRGNIQSDGQYKIYTHPREGAPLGWYKLAVLVTEPSDPKNSLSNPRWLIPKKFGKPSESGLSLEVRQDATPGTYDLVLK